MIWKKKGGILKFCLTYFFKEGLGSVDMAKTTRTYVTESYWLHSWHPTAPQQRVCGEFWHQRCVAKHFKMQE